VSCLQEGAFFVILKRVFYSEIAQFCRPGLCLKPIEQDDNGFWQVVLLHYALH